MYFKYGNYQHADGEVNLTTFTKKRMYSPRNRLTFTRLTLHVQGVLCYDTQADIKSAIDDLEDAYFDDWKDAALYHDDGKRSAHSLINKKSINGVRVLHVSFPRGDPEEYATGRSYSITLQADYPNVEDQIYSFEESLSFIGGTGPYWRLSNTYTGLPEVVFGPPHTHQRIIQRGTAMGLYAPPIIPGPLLAANYYHDDLTTIVRGSARKIGRHANLIFPVTYKYTFSSAHPINRFPRPDYPGR